MTQPLVKMVTDDEVKGQAKQLFEQIKESTGNVPKWMRVMANNEDVVVSFFGLFKVIMDDHPVNTILKWKIAKIVSQKNKCEFCVDVSDQKLKSLGLSDENLEKIEEELDEREAIAVRYAEASTEHAYNIDPELMKEMKDNFTDEELVEITSVVGLFNFINRFNDALGVLPDV